LARQSALKLDERVFDPSHYLKAGLKSKPFYASSLGALFSSDCMAVLPYIKDEVVDTVFADPPFNLGKEYGENFSDLKPDEEYLSWCKDWIGECIRTSSRVVQFSSTICQGGMSFWEPTSPNLGWNSAIGLPSKFPLASQFRGGSIRATIACFTTQKVSRKLSAESELLSRLAGIAGERSKTTAATGQL